MEFVKVPEAVRCHRLWPPVFAPLAPTLQLQHNHRAIYQYTQARNAPLPNPPKEHPTLCLPLCLSVEARGKK